MRSAYHARVIFLLIFIFSVFVNQELLAAPKIILERGISSYPLGAGLAYLEDKNGDLAIADVDTPEMAESFVRNETGVINFGFTSSVYWIKFNVENENPEVKNWLIEIGYPHLDSLKFFFPDGNGGYHIKKSGDLLPFTEREINHRLFLFKLHIETGQSQEVFLRVKTQSSFQVPLTIWEPIKFSEKVYREELGYGIYYGIMIVMVLYNLFLFFSIRDKATLYYVLYIGTFGFGIMSLNGVTAQYLWYNLPVFANKILLVSLYLAMSMLCLFSRTYLNTKQNAPRLDKSIVFLMIFGFAGSVLSLFIKYELGVKMVALFGVSCPIPTFIAGIVCWRKGIAAARYYLIAWIFLLLGIFVLALRNFGVLPSIFFTEYAVQIGSAMEVILLSLGLADRINIMKKERFLAQQEALSAQEKMLKQLQEMDRLKDEMNRNLEDKVRERTEELSQAMQETEKINRQLTETTEALWGEMELAKRIQTILLPKNPEIPGYEISVFMEPAEEVGGDYYDIIHSHGKNWIVIGDVSGHGVPAGLIMMMVQTAIHVTVSQNPDLEPSKLLSIINQTITKNIQMMGDDKYMTITVMAAYEDGHFVFSGLHQDILIYRNQDREIEVIETNGLWLGVAEDIRGFLKDEQFELDQDDMVLVFTDGLTESWEKGVDPEKRSPDINMFGQDRLKQALKELGDVSTDHVLRGIIATLKAYETTDDITMVALKRL
ncbi:MAG: SpoIIE family protein phosphatase [Proteobacteria bacterium]|nr:SpoIIE family protein phosphatase [Pseudomonadota bacterium]